MTIIICQKHKQNTGVNLCEHLDKAISNSKSAININKILLTYNKETELDAFLCDLCVKNAKAENNQSYELGSEIGEKVYEFSKFIVCAGCFEAVKNNK